MNSNQYKQVAQTTMNQALESGADELTAVRAACDNLGVALPNGTSGEVAETLATNDYMGWRACTAEEAQAAANEGVAALYTDGEAVSLVLPDAEVTVLGSGAYYTYNAASTTTVIPPEEEEDEEPVIIGPILDASRFFSQANTNIRYPASDAALVSNPSASVFQDNEFLTKVCGKTTKNTIQSSGCAVCSVAMFILHKAGLAATNENVYQAVREAVDKTTNAEFDYYRHSYTVNVAGKSIAIFNPNTDLMQNLQNADKSVTIFNVKNAIEEGKCVVVCLNGDSGWPHFVLADSVSSDETVDILERIKVVDPNGGVRRTLKEAIQEVSANVSVTTVLTAYAIY